MTGTKRFLLPLVTSVLFSGSYVAAKVAANELDPLTTTLLRYLIALGALSLIGVGYGRSHLRVAPRDFWVFAMLGLTGIVGYHYFFFQAVRDTDVANTAIINALSPVVTGVLAWILMRERLRGRSYAGIAVAVCGVLVLLSKGSVQNVLSIRFARGDLMMMLAVLSWAIYSLGVKRLSEQYSGFTLTFYSTLCGVAWLLIFVLSGDALAKLRGISPTAMLAIAYMGVCASGLGYLTYNLSVRAIGPTRTSSFVYGMNPVFVAVLAWSLFAQPITSVMVASMVLIVVGLRMSLSGSGSTSVR